MPTYTPLQSIQLTEATSSVTFSGIPQIYQDLVIVANAGNNGGTGYGLSVQFNGDTASNYSFTHAYGTGSSAVSARSSNTTFILGGFTPSSIGGSTCVINVLNYSNTTTNKTVLSRGSEADYRVSAIVGLWRSTSAVTSIRLLDEGANNFLAGSTFDLYGISPVAANNAQAAGGTDIYYDASYVYHVFKGSGTFTPYRNLNAEYLVVAGGGGGGGRPSGGGGTGGGGAGGYRTNTGGSAVALTANTSYTVTVGAGGPGGAGGGENNGTKGSNSVFSTITSTGGGYGPGYGFAAGTGGSGGGGAQSGTGQTGGAGNQGGYSPVEGYAGGNGAETSTGAGGGGGGAAAVGSNSNSDNGGAGGAGSSSCSAWGLATSTGQNVSGTYFFAGGGGGGGASNGTTRNGGTGGNGGGGTGYGKPGGVDTAAISGITNTGSGGGGGGNGFGGGSGGSGIVIVRYAR